MRRRELRNAVTTNSPLLIVRERIGTPASYLSVDAAS